MEVGDGGGQTGWMIETKVMEGRRDDGLNLSLPLELRGSDASDAKRVLCDYQEGM